MARGGGPLARVRRDREAPSRSGVALAALLCLAASARAADNPELIQEGEMLASGFCDQCHGIGPARASPVDAAPPFRALAEDPALTEQEIRQLLRTNHEATADFILSDPEREALAAYIKSLARP
jgi:mono/diheme cytochrome c family protein